jgi:hypothetical protein
MLAVTPRGTGAYWNTISLSLLKEQVSTNLTYSIFSIVFLLPVSTLVIGDFTLWGVRFLLLII